MVQTLQNKLKIGAAVAAVGTACVLSYIAGGNNSAKPTPAEPRQAYSASLEGTAVTPEETYDVPEQQCSETEESTKEDVSPSEKEERIYTIGEVVSEAYQSFFEGIGRIPR
jgi:hypothetical protein